MAKLSNTDAVRKMPGDRRYTSPMSTKRAFMDAIAPVPEHAPRPTGPNETKGSLRDAINWMKDNGL